MISKRKAHARTLDNGTLVPVSESFVEVSNTPEPPVSVDDLRKEVVLDAIQSPALAFQASKVVFDFNQRSTQEKIEWLRSPNVSQELLVFASTHPSPEVRCGVMASPAATIEILRGGLDDKDERVQYLARRNLDLVESL